MEKKAVDKSIFLRSGKFKLSDNIKNILTILVLTIAIITFVSGISSKLIETRFKEIISERKILESRIQVLEKRADSTLQKDTIDLFNLKFQNLEQNLCELKTKITKLNDNFYDLFVKQSSKNGLTK